MRIAKEGLIFIAPSLAAFAACWALGFRPAAVFFLVLAAAFLFFFRNPRRVTPPGENRLVSPADGKIIRIDRMPGHPRLPSPVTRISIFLSLFDVHITRSPVSAVVERVEYQPGKFFPANKDEASAANESNTLFLKGADTDLVVKQIVGVAARRIKCFVKPNEHLDRGQKIGLMYFGSRVEVYLPEGLSIKAGLGQKVRAGETVIAEVEK